MLKLRRPHINLRDNILCNQSGAHSGSWFLSVISHVNATFSSWLISFLCQHDNTNKKVSHLIKYPDMKETSDNLWPWSPKPKVLLSSCFPDIDNVV